MAKNTRRSTRAGTGSAARPAAKPPAARHVFGRDSALIIALLALATLVVYARVARFPFIDLDDSLYVSRNPHVQGGITAASVEWAFTTLRCTNWHPLTWLSHTVDWQLYGANAGGHHVTSVLLHIANAVLLFYVLSRMTGAVWRSGFVAALFALHPLHVESVAWVAERKDVLSTLFWMLTMLAYAVYAERRTARRYMLLIAAFALGLMAKPMLVSLPIALLLLDVWPLKRSGRRLAEYAPLFALAAASCAITWYAQSVGGATKSLDRYAIGTRAANAAVAYVEYVWRMLWPRSLGPFYPHPENTLPVWQVIGAAVVLAAITCLAIYSMRKAPYVFVGWMWYLVTLVPVIGLVQVGLQGSADRYTYIPLIGLFVIAAWGVPDVLAKALGSRSRLILAPIGAIVIACLAACTWVQVGYWRSNEVLIDRAIECSGGHYSVIAWKASYLNKTGRREEAFRILSRCRENRPGLALVESGLGSMLSDMGRLDQAIVHLKKAIALRPNLAMAHNNLGIAYERQGRTAAALREFRRAARIDPRYSDPPYNIACALAMHGRPEEALRIFEQTVRADPDMADAYTQAAIVLVNMGRQDEAIAHFLAAIEADPYSAQAPCMLGMTYLRTGRTDDAIPLLRKAAAMKPNWGQPHRSLAMALYNKGEYEEASREARMAQQFGCPPSPAFLRALGERMGGR